MLRPIIISHILLLLVFSGCRKEDTNLPEVPDITYKEDVITGNPLEQKLKGENTTQWVRTKMVSWTEEVDPDYHHASEAAMERFRDMKIGIRIHWGVYSLNGSNPSWSLWYKKGQVQNDSVRYPESAGSSNDEYVEYMKHYSTMYQDFNPVDYDPAEWARLFKEAGLKFAVLTSKHHDGFSIFHTDTEVNALKRTFEPDGTVQYEKIRIPYSIENTPYKKDIVKGFCEEMRKAGLGVGVYFSNPDWNDYDFRFGQHNIFRDPGYTRESDPIGWERALRRYRAQLTELASKYGKIDILSLDHGLPMEAWPEMKATIKQVRKLQPEVMIRRRGIGAYGDHFTPEGGRPVFPGDSGREDELTFHRYPVGKPWSKIGGTSGHPGYMPDMKEVNTKKVIHQLIEICSHGGIMQVGFGPDSDGKFHPEVLAFFKELGAWLKVNGKGIYETRSCEGLENDEDTGIYYTRSKDQKTLYAFMTQWPGEQVNLPSFIPKSGSGILLAGHSGSLEWESVNGELRVIFPDEVVDDPDLMAKEAWMLIIENGAPEFPVK